MKLTEHEKKILELVQSNPVILTNRDERRKVAEKIGLTEKTLRNRIADLKKYGVIGADVQAGDSTIPVSESEDMTLLNIFLIIWQAKWKIFRNVFIVSVLVVILVLIMPLTYRSVAVIMPPTTENSLNLSSALSSLPFGNFIGGTGDTKAMTFIAILESRLVKEDIITKFNLMDFYDDKYIEDALQDLSDHTSIELQDEGTIKIAFSAKTSWFHPEDEIRQCKILARDITNYYVTKLDEVNKTLTGEEARNNRLFIEKRYALNQSELKKAEDALKQFQEQYHLVSPEDQTSAAIDIASQLKSQIMADEIKIQILKKTLPANHPDLLNLYQEKTLLSKQLQDLNEGKSNDFLLPKFRAIPDLGLEYARLTRQIEVQNQIFVFLTQQYEEAKIKEARDMPTLQVLDYGKLAQKKYKPSRARVCIVGFLLSLIASVYYYYFKNRWYESRR